ncbi:flagellar hook-associated protein 2 [Pseudoalteromonas ulvae UL12]|uniref:Flagellar hook-associated protein 2 n=1 Tax=Pseudoalteromonas ulvae TaxID=107327 RepID=A0A244CSL0_PSEDV|nr:flagellar filament capping protein FliD [Pseudoalteromonas ulvae]MBE0363739.1 flagellar hook-associated protein 2 [Pseudoalteromonas ulvae UL12]OUL58583.1 hypothetical protein B1199_09695 [Pseudoalteromonas ulvae]
MPSLSSPGIGSGLDVNSIVTQLVEAERKPFDDKTLKTEEKYTAQVSDLGKLKSAISDLNDALFDLKLPTTFSKRSVESASSKFDVEAGSAALPASYDIKVDQVAQSQTITSKAFDLTTAVGQGTLTLKNSSSSFNIEVSASDTLDSVAANINSSGANFGVTASIINGENGSYLVLSADKTGLESAIEIEVTDQDGQGYDNSGLSQLAFSAKNTVLAQTFTAGEVMNADGTSNGVITLANGTSSENINILATDTIEDVVNKINANSINVTASLEDDGAGGKKLALVSTNDYGNHQVSIAIASDDDGNTTDLSGISRLAHSYSPNNYVENQAASDAKITVNGAISASSSTNTFDKVVAGVALTVKSAHAATDAADKITVSLDKGSTEEAVGKFVDSFNAMLDVVKQVTNADKETGSVGSLISDSTVRTFLGQLRESMGDAVPIENNLSLSLSMIGVSTQKDGTLKLDNKELKKQIDTNFEHFGTFFSGEKGIARSLADVVNEYKGTGGIVDNKIKSINGYMEKLNEEKDKFNTKMVKYESRLFSQFNTMDLLVANLNATSQYLTGALDNLPGVVKKSK